METQNPYSELIKLARKNDLSAYNNLCTEFLGYVPLVMEDLYNVAHYCKVETEDLHQEGYLAVCEALQEIIHSDKEYTMKEISDIVVRNITKHIMSMSLDDIEKRAHEQTADIKYDESDSFHEYLTKIRNNAEYRIKRDSIIKAYRFNQNPKVANAEKVILLRLLPEDCTYIVPLEPKNNHEKELIDFVMEQLERCVFFTYKTTLYNYLNL